MADKVQIEETPDTTDDLQIVENPEVVFTINFKPSYVIIIIDTHSSMFKTRLNPDDNAETQPFKDALTACYEIADSLILSKGRNKYNQFGVVLATEDDKASFIEVENNLLDSIKLLKKESSLTTEELKAKYERNTNLDLGALFLLCKKKFKNINSEYYKRHLIFLTDDDEPLKGDSQKKYTALNEIKTFDGNNIYFELISMRNDFDYTKFYNELFSKCSEAPTTDEICQDKDGLVEKLLSTIVFRYTKLRIKFYPFANEFNRYLKLMKVNFIRKTKLFNDSKASLDGRLLKKVRAINPNSNSADASAFLLKMGIGEELLRLTAQDKNDIDSNNLPLGLHLQYVSDRQLNTGVIVNRTSILTLDPKEDLKYFDEFWQYCINNNKVLVCIKKYRNPAPIRYVELVPRFSNNQRLFLIKDLPFCDEYIPPKILAAHRLPTFEVTREKEQVIDEFIDSLSFNYDPKTFVNLSYAKKKAYIKSQLLDEPEEEVTDAFAQSTQSIDSEINDIVNNIKTVFTLPAIDQSKKRKAPAGSSKSTKSKRK